MNAVWIVVFLVGLSLVVHFANQSAQHSIHAALTDKLGSVQFMKDNLIKIWNEQQPTLLENLKQRLINDLETHMNITKTNLTTDFADLFDQKSQSLKTILQSRVNELMQDLLSEYNSLATTLSTKTSEHLQQLEEKYTHVSKNLEKSYNEARGIIQQELDNAQHQIQKDSYTAKDQLQDVFERKKTELTTATSAQMQLLQDQFSGAKELLKKVDTFSSELENLRISRNSMATQLLNQSLELHKMRSDVDRVILYIRTQG